MTQQEIEFVDRPWGGYAILAQGDSKRPIAAVKVLSVDPGGVLSLQRHQYRSERWVPLADGLCAYVHDGDEAHVGPPTMLRAGQALDIRPGELHRLWNPTGCTLQVVEILTGFYDEDDIERVADEYGRE